jgi:hypothetical protein
MVQAAMRIASWSIDKKGRVKDRRTNMQNAETKDRDRIASRAKRLAWAHSFLSNKHSKIARLIHLEP